MCLIIVTYPKFRLSIGVQTTTLLLRSSLASSNLKELSHSSGTLRTGESCHVSISAVANFCINRDEAKWVGQVRDVIEVHEQGTPQFRRMLWRQAFETPSYQMFFQPPEEKTWNYVLQATMDSVVDRASSKSYIAILPEDTKAQVQDNLRHIIDQGDKVWVDQSKGVFEYPYYTLVVIAQKK